MLAEGDANACEALSKTPDLVNALFDASRVGTAALQQVEAYARKYHFFHYEVAFPEAFARARKGFDIIVGNPPWDKTKWLFRRFSLLGQARPGAAAQGAQNPDGERCA
jgi:hypothetical protein